VASLIAFSAPATAHAAPAQRAGVQLHVLWSDVDDAEMDRQLDLVQQSGAAMARVDVGWASLQEKGPDDWEAYHLRRLDRLVDGAQARGIQLLLIFMNSPCWASSAPDSLKQGCTGSWWSRGVSQYAPSDPQDYARALAHVVARYKGRVAGWELWNEPNSSDYFKTSGDAATAYANLVKAAYPAAKAADPDTTIVAGALSQSDYRFTQQLYDQGIKGSFDAYSVHPYSDDVSPLDPRSSTDPRYSFVRGVEKIHDTMLANGDSRPVWLTESGWSTSIVRNSSAWRNGVSEDDQARFMRQQAQQVQQWSWVKVNIWYELNDVGTDRADVFSNCGLRRVDGTAKPAWATFREVAAQLQQEPQDGGPAPSTDPPAGDDPSGGDTPSPSSPSAGSPAPGPAASQPAPAQQPGGAPVVPAAVTPAPATSSAAGNHAADQARHARRVAARARAKARKAAAAAKRARRAAARGRISHLRLKAVLHRATVARQHARLAVARSHAATAAVAAVARS
jgi:polysaccharide biosynthesis protein PslG